MAIVLTLKEASAAGFEKATSSAVASIKAASKGIQIANQQPGYICYIGPCEPGTGKRLVCYYDEEKGCHDDFCYLEPDSACD